MPGEGVRHGADREPADLPGELDDALSRQATVHETLLDGRIVSWLSWGAPERRPLVFVHGGAAHAWWWSFTAPLLADNHHVIALDLSGHGDSSRRSAYSFHGWVDEVVAVLEEQPCRLPPVIVGHSMGGIVVSLLASRLDVPLAGLIVVDAPLSTAGDQRFGDDNVLLGQRRSYASREEAIARFRLVPAQGVRSGYLLEHVARHSIRFDAGSHGWTWKFDDAVFAEHPDDRPSDLWSLLDAGSCPVGFIVGTESDVVVDADRKLLETPGVLGSSDPASVGRFLRGGHHLMFDRPVELIDTVRDFLRVWLVHDSPEASPT